MSSSFGLFGVKIALALVIPFIALVHLESNGNMEVVAFRADVSTKNLRAIDKVRRALERCPPVPRTPFAGIGDSQTNGAAACHRPSIQPHAKDAVQQVSTSPTVDVISPAEPKTATPTLDQQVSSNPEQSLHRPSAPIAQVVPQSSSQQPSEQPHSTTDEAPETTRHALIRVSRGKHPLFRYEQKAFISPQMPIRPEIVDNWNYQLKERFEDALRNTLQDLDSPVMCLAVECMMAGTDPRQLRPCIIVTCDSEPLQKKLSKVIKRLSWISSSGLRCMAIVQPVRELTSLSSGQIAGLVLGSIGVLFAIIALPLWCRIRRQRRHTIREEMVERPNLRTIEEGNMSHTTSTLAPATIRALRRAADAPRLRWRSSSLGENELNPLGGQPEWLSRRRKRELSNSRPASKLDRLHEAATRELYGYTMREILGKSHISLDELLNRQLREEQGNDGSSPMVDPLPTPRATSADVELANVDLDNDISHSVVNYPLVQQVNVAKGSQDMTELHKRSHKPLRACPDIDVALRTSNREKWASPVSSGVDSQPDGSSVEDLNSTISLNIVADVAYQGNTLCSAFLRPSLSGWNISSCSLGGLIRVIKESQTELYALTAGHAWCDNALTKTEVSFRSKRRSLSYLRTGPKRI